MSVTFNENRLFVGIFPKCKIGMIAVLLSPSVLAVVNGDAIFQRQSQQQDARQQQFEASPPDIRLQLPSKTTTTAEFLRETVCFDITDKSFSYTDALVAIGTGALSQGKGAIITGGISVGGAYVGSTVKCCWWFACR